MKLNNVPMGVAIRYACMATATQTRIERYAVVIKDRMCGCGSGSDESALTAALPRPVSANARRFQDRLNRMFVNVDFEKVRLQDAAVFLQRRSQELDPAKKGINLVLVKGERAAAQEGANPAPGITLRLSQVPLEEALHYACMLAGGRYRIEDDSVVVTLP